jgi:hypothetical protein
VLRANPSSPSPTISIDNKEFPSNTHTYHFFNNPKSTQVWSKGTMTRHYSRYSGNNPQTKVEEKLSGVWSDRIHQCLQHPTFPVILLSKAWKSTGRNSIIQCRMTYPNSIVRQNFQFFENLFSYKLDAFLSFHSILMQKN